MQTEYHADIDVGFTSPFFTVRESDGQVNIQVGVLSDLLITFNIFVTDMNGFGEVYLLYRMD